MDFRTQEDALRAWVKAGSGLDDAHVFFHKQNGPQPADGPYITISAGDSFTALGIDESSRVTDLTQPTGQEITQTATGMRDVRLTIQAYEFSTVNYTPQSVFPLIPPVGSGRTAFDMLASVQTALSLDSVRYALNAAGLGVYDEGQIRRLDSLVATDFEGRAVLEVGMYMSDTATEQSGYINEVEGTGTVVTDAGNVTIPLDVGNGT